MSSLGKLLVYYDEAAPPKALVALCDEAATMVGGVRKLPVMLIPKSDQKKQARAVVPATREAFEGDAVILKLAARFIDASVGSSFAGRPSDPRDATYIDFFVDRSAGKGVPLPQLDGHLASRTYLVGASWTVADFAVWASLTKGKKAPKVGKLAHVARWLAMFPALESEQGAADDEKKADGLDLGEELTLDMPHAHMGKVVTRFPPEPSGYLHIGHVKAVLTNFLVARKYRGKFVVRLDDTNPAKENVEFVDNILRDLHTLGVEWAKLSYTSDSFDLILEYATKLIKEGKAYCDKTPVDQMREERMKCQPSAARENSIEENLRLWAEMQKGSEEGCLTVLRGKFDPSLWKRNGTLRDPVLYRVNVETPHHRTGTKYKVYPSYDLAIVICDSVVDGVTHTMRSQEFHDRDEQYYMLCDMLGIRKPFIWEFSRLNFLYTVMSKRKLAHFVKMGYVDGWNDPRFPTVQGIMRRGMTVEALRMFIAEQASSQTYTKMEWDKIWALNKKVLEPKSHRLMAVAQQGAVKVTLADVAADETKDVPLHPKHPEFGTRPVLFSKHVLLEGDDAALIDEGEELTLLNWGNIVVDRIIRDGDGGAVQAIEAHTNLEGDFKKTKKKLHWLADSTKVGAEMIEFDHLITVPEIEDDTDIESVRNVDSRKVTAVWIEPHAATLAPATIVQFMRRGYVRVDKAADGADPMQFVFIPDGKGKSMSNVISGVIIKTR